MTVNKMLCSEFQIQILCKADSILNLVPL